MCKVPFLMEEAFDSELEVQLVLPAKDDAIAWSECWPHFVALIGCTIQPVFLPHGLVHHYTLLLYFHSLNRIMHNKHNPFCRRIDRER